MVEGDKVSRAIEPRPVQVVMNTTKEVRERLETLAKYNRWSLSKTAYLAVVEGLPALERAADVPVDFLEGG